MSADDLADLMDLMLRGTRDDVTTILNDPAASMIKLLTARLMEQALVEGDVQIVNALWNRLVGKPKESKDVSLTGADGQPVAIKAHEASTEELQAEIARLQAMASSVADD